MRRMVCLFFFLAVVIAPGCATSPSGGGMVNVTGTVQHITLEGGFWAIRGDDGKTYDPVGGLPAEFQKEGLRVRLDAKARPDVASFHMVGPMVDIVKIQRL